MERWGVRIFIKGQWVDLKDIIEKAEKYEAAKSWWLVFNQFIEPGGAKDRLAEVLEV